MVEVDPALAETKVGPLVNVSDPPLPLVNVSTRLRLERVTFPVLVTTMV